MARDSITLATGYAIPLMGFGTWELKGNVCEVAVQNALRVGYRHIDTASTYGNEREVGNALAASGIPRGELFITTKLWRADLSPEKVRPALEESLSKLGTDYIDLFLIHWPDARIPMTQTLAAMQKAADEGLIRSIGVSNCTIQHLVDALASGVVIATNQVEFHPSLYQKKLLEYCRAEHIAVEAYSPLAGGFEVTIPEIQAIARELRLPPPSVILSWILSKNIVALSRTSSLKHLQENWDAQFVTLSDQHVSLLDSLTIHHRSISPDHHEFGSEA